MHPEVEGSGCINCFVAQSLWSCNLGSGELKKDWLGGVVPVSFLLVFLVGLNSGKQKSVLRVTIVAPANLIRALRGVKYHRTWKRSCSPLAGHPWGSTPLVVIMSFGIFSWSCREVAVFGIMQQSSKVSRSGLQIAWYCCRRALWSFRPH